MFCVNINDLYASCYKCGLDVKFRFIVRLQVVEPILNFSGLLCVVSAAIIFFVASTGVLNLTYGVFCLLEMFHRHLKTEPCFISEICFCVHIFLIFIR